MKRSDWTKHIQDCVKWKEVVEKAKTSVQFVICASVWNILFSCIVFFVFHETALCLGDMITLKAYMLFPEVMTTVKA
jgi:hypothetical protein